MAGLAEGVVVGLACCEEEWAEEGYLGARCEGQRGEAAVSVMSPNDDMEL